MFKVLVVDDDHDLRLSVKAAFSEKNFDVQEAVDGEEAVNRVKAGRFDLVLLDVNMPRLNGLQALREIKDYDPSIIVIMLTAFSNIGDAVEATKKGAYNYLEKPIHSENLVYIVEQAIRASRMVRNISYSAPVFKLPDYTEFVGQSSEMKRIFRVIDKLSQVDTAVLIRGESGTGKELVARALHFNGPRKENRFVTLNCSAIPDNLIESEFFGHEKGAFTGADSRKIGKFQYADGGTLFLDEIGDVSPAMQVKLLRVLQEKRFTPVGSNREIEVNVRIVAATHQPLEDLIRKGRFREDLFYRLNVLPIELPPLRERKNDIEALVGLFVEKFNSKHRKKMKGVSQEVVLTLKEYAWPGNIRELENVIEHAFVIESTDRLTMESLPSSVLTGTAPNGLTRSIRSESPVLHLPEEGWKRLSGSNFFSKDSRLGGVENSSDPLMEQNEGKISSLGFRVEMDRLDFQANKEEFEKQFLLSALRTFKGRINKTALHANIPKKTLLRKLVKYGINAKDFGEKTELN